MAEFLSGLGSLVSPVSAVVENLRKNPIRTAWDVLSPLPLGKKLYSVAVGQAAPYSGSIGARVVDLREGLCRIELRERRAVRQHLGSVHAIALANLGELTTGLAMYYSLPGSARGIVTRFEMSYEKKARGLLTAECRTEPFGPQWRCEQEEVKELVAEIRDTRGDRVATATAHWLIRPR